MEERLTIDQLAHEVGMTARNIRAHQTRGLLPPPELVGRTGYYGAEHSARLRLIKDMQSSGFNLGSIKNLLDAAPVGAGPEILRFERAVMAPWRSEKALVFEADELSTMFGGHFDAAVITKAVDLGVIVDLGEGRFEVPSPSLVRAGARVVALGIPVERVLEILERLKVHADGVAETFVGLFLNDIWKPFEDAGSSEAEWRNVNDSLEQLRPIASEVLLAVFEQSMGRTVEAAFGQRLQRPGSATGEAG